MAAGVPFFFKQWGGHTPKAGGRHLDGKVWSQMPALHWRKQKVIPVTPQEKQLALL
jgi:hypothetical protein